MKTEGFVSSVFRSALCLSLVSFSPLPAFCLSSSEAPCQWSPVCACCRGPSGSWRWCRIQTSPWWAVWPGTVGSAPGRHAASPEPCGTRRGPARCTWPRSETSAWCPSETPRWSVLSRSQCSFWWWPGPWVCKRNHQRDELFSLNDGISLIYSHLQVDLVLTCEQYCGILEQFHLLLAGERHLHTCNKINAAVLRRLQRCVREHQWINNLMKTKKHSRNVRDEVGENQGWVEKLWTSHRSILNLPRHFSPPTQEIK